MSVYGLPGLISMTSPCFIWETDASGILRSVPFILCSFDASVGCDAPPRSTAHPLKAAVAAVAAPASAITNNCRRVTPSVMGRQIKHAGSDRQPPGARAGQGTMLLQLEPHWNVADTHDLSPMHASQVSAALFTA